MDQHLQVAKIAAQKAGEIALKYFRGEFTISTKRNEWDLVTTADFESEKEIVKIIREHFPDEYILSEEKQKDSLEEKKLWIVDPIDGTSNFAVGLPLWCISIAYVVDGVVQLGVVYNPTTNDWFTAIKNKGAYLNDKKLHVSPTNTLRQSLVSYDYSSVDEYRSIIKEISKRIPNHARGIRVLGSAALEFSFVAAGFLDAYLTLGSKPWDIAAGALFVEEAGGKVTDWKGNKWKFNESNYLVSNGAVTKELLELVTDGIVAPPVL